ncbi:MAG: type I glyceraldehyde-3-phosphate dehydrogenase [Candidatus Daviesbacteria bacterium]|nr:type I glyceraldehyde-3-phosphate dehydrogenase [Candidatus Daviesbacteria bacterium]
MLKVAINGFGRIGRTAFKIALDKFSDQLEIVAINDLGDAKTLSHLLKYDSNYGIWNHDISNDEKHIIVDQKPYLVLQEKDPQNLPWKDLNVDVVIESTGRFTDQKGSKLHLQAGAKKVVISAPAKGDGSSVPTLLLGVNDEKYSGDEIISNSSCTTNCIAPVAKVMSDKFGILKAMMTTIHAYTQDQNLQDGPHKDLRRARSASQNIVPTSTGAAISITEVIPELKGKFDGTSLRVPVAVGSISDFTFLLKRKVTVEEVNQSFKEAADSSEMKGILAVTEDPVVSSDIVGRPESAIVDLSLTQVVDGDMVKVFAWYDNEYGYSNRLIEQVINVGKASD